jgi:hypothetical protein
LLHPNALHGEAKLEATSLVCQTFPSLPGLPYVTGLVLRNEGIELPALISTLEPRRGYLLQYTSTWIAPLPVSPQTTSLMPPEDAPPEPQG